MELCAVDPDETDAVRTSKHEAQVRDERDESALAATLAGRTDRSGELDGGDVEVAAGLGVRDRPLAPGLPLNPHAAFGRGVMPENAVKGIPTCQLIHPADGSRNPKPSVRPFGQVEWWRRRDSNPHGLRQEILSLSRLPISPRRPALILTPPRPGRPSAPSREPLVASRGRRTRPLDRREDPPPRRPLAVKYFDVPAVERRVPEAQSLFSKPVWPRVAFFQ